MVTEVLFDEVVVAAGGTSSAVLVGLADLGASGDFGLEVDCDNPVTITYKASAENDTPGGTEDTIATHPGGGKKTYWPSIAPFAKVWFYAKAPAGGAGATVSATLNVW